MQIEEWFSGWRESDIKKESFRKKEKILECLQADRNDPVEREKNDSVGE